MNRMEEPERKHTCFGEYKAMAEAGHCFAGCPDMADCKVKSSVGEVDDTPLSIPEEIKEKIVGSCGRLSSYLNLQEWTGRIIFKDVGIESIAEISINYDYLSYDVSIDECKLADKISAPDIVTEILVHELLHIIIDPLYLFGVDAVTNQTIGSLEGARERTVSRLTKIVMKGLPEDLYFSEKTAP